MQKQIIQTTQIRSKNSNLIPNARKASEFEEFCLWYAMPYAAKKEMRMEKQKEFAEAFNVDPATLSIWKSRAEFIARVNYLRNQWAHEKSMDVIDGIYRAAVKGNPHSQKLWAQMFMGFTEKTEVKETKAVEISTNDIRHLIEQLPDNLKEKHYGNLRELLDDASAVANARDVENRSWTTRPQAIVSNEADNNAQNIPSRATYGVAESDQKCVCKNMERQVSAYNY